MQFKCICQEICTGEERRGRHFTCQLMERKKKDNLKFALHQRDQSPLALKSFITMCWCYIYTPVLGKMKILLAES